MIRIFLTLSLLSLGMLALAAGFGLAVGDLTEQATDLATRGRFRVHFLIGVIAALAVVLVNSIAVTYFIGTSRWCKEVVDTYKLNRELIQRSNKLKRSAFPWALVGMLTVVGLIALGAASDPSTAIANTARWRDWHFVAALAGSALIGWAYFMLWNKIHQNQAIIQEVMREVNQIRSDRGLEV